MDVHSVEPILGSIPVSRESNDREKRTARYGAGDLANRFSIG